MAAGRRSVAAGAILPFDRSGCDLTAHALRALPVGRKEFGTCSNMFCGHSTLQGSSRNAQAAFTESRASHYLARTTQRPDGSWLPLWFGNQHAPDDENPDLRHRPRAGRLSRSRYDEHEPARRGVAWLLSAQNADGGWGGAAEHAVQHRGNGPGRRSAARCRPDAASQP